jgi:parallel beta-helix repeat protein
LVAAARKSLGVASCALICAVAVLVAAGGAGAHATAVACGDTITADTNLTADLTGCAGNGLIVGGTGVRLNLNGHIVSGSGAGTGITVTGADAAVVNGTVRGFDVGASSQGSGTRLANLTVTADRLGVVAISQSGLLDRSTISLNGGDGVTAVGATGWTIRDSRIANNAGTGIVLIQSHALTIAHNKVKRNTGDGIELRSHVDVSTVRDNNASHNGGVGIRITDSTSKVVHNVARSNGNTGILLSEGESVASLSLYEITGNNASKNGGAGIVATAGMTDGGGNKARQNAAAPECVNVACKD